MPQQHGDMDRTSQDIESNDWKQCCPRIHVKIYWKQFCPRIHVKVSCLSRLLADKLAASEMRAMTPQQNEEPLTNGVGKDTCFYK